MDIKYIGGADPEMVFLDNGEETERVSVINMSEEEIIELLSSHGIHKRSAETAEEEGQGEEEQERQEL